MSGPLRNGFEQLARLRGVVEQKNACALPGCSIVYDRFLTVMWRAVSRGYVHDDHAAFVQHSLTHGFDLGFDPSRLARHGRIVYQPYASAMENAGAVADAIFKRIDGLKTLCLGEWQNRPHDIPFDDCLVFPCGAVEKNPLYAPGEYRPVSDHTKSGFNPACIGDIYAHVLATHRDVAHFLQSGYVMLVSDVDGAFPILPLAPWLWPFMLFLVPLVKSAGRRARRRLHLCVHLFADFGTRFAPGAFYIFFVKVVLNMARSELILTLPAVVHVDDLALIGECAVTVDEEGTRLAEWSTAVAGVDFKVIKTRPAACRQLYVGLWWDSNSRALELEERRLRSYIALLWDYGSRPVLSLHDRQSIAGKMHRAALTLPPGASCLISAVYGMMMGLSLPWHRRRTTRLERLNYRAMAQMLESNGGKGYFDRSHLPWAPPICSDAMKSRERAGGGFVSACGAVHWQPYGRGASRDPIDAMEGDWVEVALDRLGPTWRGKRVPFGVDNQAFQRSQVKGRSRADRLMDIIRRIFFKQIEFGCVLELYWLSSADNLLADLVSRDQVEEFWHHVTVSGFWDTPHFERVRVFPDTGKSRTRAACVGKGFKADIAGDGPSRTGFPQRSTVSHKRAALWDGLPSSLADELDRVLDNRLGASSLRSMAAAVKIWCAVCLLYEFDPIIETDDSLRGGKCAAFVLYMMADTSLVWASIENYVWAWREWMVLQRQADPVMGVMTWDRFLDAVRVLTIVPTEPRRMLPLADFVKIMEALDWDDFYEVQFGCFLLIQLFTFSRSECPCPKSLDGFDLETHWAWEDIVMTLLSSVPTLNVRFKKVKQDRRMERPSARPTEDEPTVSGDWVYIGDVPGTIFSVDRWFKRLLGFGVRRFRGQPFFLHRDRVQPFTYTAGLDFLRVMQRRVGVSEVPGLHGIRVLGNNLSRNTNGEDLTQFHGGWLSRAGRSRYDRFEPRDVVSIPARMVGRPSPLAEGPEGREVLRFSHLERRGPQAGDPVQRLVLPDGLSGVALTGRTRPDAALAAAPAAAALLRPPARAASVDELGSDPRGEGVLLPAGYVEETRVARSRSYKVVRAPDGKVLQSRPEAWRHHAMAASRAFQESIGGVYAFGGSPSEAASSSPPGSVHPPTPSPEPSPEVAQPNAGSSSRSACFTPSAGQPASAPGPRGKGKRGSRLRAELR